MEQPAVVIGVTGGIAECLSNPGNVDYLILDFDALDEYGTQEDAATLQALIDGKLFNEASEALADLEERIDKIAGF